MPLDDLIDRADKRVYERRGQKRRIYRLNWGKLLSLEREFLSEAIMANFSTNGACLRIARRIVIPPFFLLYNDNSGDIFEGEVIWRMGSDLGARLATTTHRDRSAVARRMREKFYIL